MRSSPTVSRTPTPRRDPPSRWRTPRPRRRRPLKRTRRPPGRRPSGPAAGLLRGEPALQQRGAPGGRAGLGAGAHRAPRRLLHDGGLRRRAVSPLDHARQLLERGQLGLAERAARALCAGAAPDPAALALLAEILERAGRHGEALPSGSARRSAPLPSPRLRGLGSLLLRAGQTEPAVAPLEQAIALEPGSGEPRLLPGAARAGAPGTLAAHLEALAEGSAAPGRSRAASASWAMGTSAARCAAEAALSRSRRGDRADRAAAALSSRAPGEAAGGRPARRDQPGPPRAGSG